MGDEEEDLSCSSPLVGSQSRINIDLGVENGFSTPLQSPRKTPNKRLFVGDAGNANSATIAVPFSPFSDSSGSFQKYPPEIFDKISFNPERDDNSIVKFSNSLDLISSTIPRLIVQLTRHDILDYNFMSDFFLSYRNFMSSNDVLECLFSRMIWAINCHYNLGELNSANTGDFNIESGKDIAIRTFVVLRHWILNFFPDDFLVSFRLRSMFSSTINKLYSWKLVQDEVQFKRIIEQLKKAWIRVCCMYWQLGTPLVSENFDITLPIFPGGTYGRVNMKKQTSKSPVRNGDTNSMGITDRTIPNSNQYQDHTPAQRRSTLLSFYKGPIKPALSTSNLKDFQNFDGIIPGNNGSLINGGITLSSDVEVKSIKPPTPVRVLERASPNSLNPKRSIPPPTAYKRSLKSIIEGWKEQTNKPKVNRFLSKFSNIMTIPKPKDSIQLNLTDQKRNSNTIRIDILSARVIEELDLFLKMKLEENSNNSTIKQTRRSNFHRLSNATESPTKRQKVNNIREGVGLYSIGKEEEDLEEEKNLSFNDKFITSISSRRTSMIDNLRIQDSLINVSAFTLHDDNISEHTNFSDALSSLTSSGKDDSLYSFVSYDSVNSITTTGKKEREDDNPNGLRKLRRWGNHENLREITNLSDLNQDKHVRSFSEQNRDKQSIRSIVSELSIQSSSKASDKMILPYSGVDSEVAARLAAIPDDTPDDDAINAALLKLEGKYVKKPKSNQPTNFINDDEQPNNDYNDLTHSDSVDSVPKVSVQYSSNHNSNLFKAAFESKLDIAGLTNASLSKPTLSTPTKRVTSSIKTYIQSPARSTRSAQDPLSLENIIAHGNHTPFILDFGSSALCDQFTLIEKDALAEIDWKELIEMRWSKKVDPIQSWLELLIERRSHGVDLVISRFNLMVNWIKSEILLTRQLDERVQTISRFIHIGHHARNIQNYTTVMQITLALQSVVISKLKNTWAGIPKNDNELLKELIELTSPLRNFGKLRSELDELQSNKGCVPFVGMYLSDLTFNNERPSFINVGNNKLINFEKFQTSSSVVKSLLQCIQWSTNYKLKPNNDLLAKCLYIQSLTVEEMDMCFDYIIDP